MINLNVKWEETDNFYCIVEKLYWLLQKNQRTVLGLLNAKIKNLMANSTLNVLWKM